MEGHMTDSINTDNILTAERLQDLVRAVVEPYTPGSDADISAKVEATITRLTDDGVLTPIVYKVNEE